MERRRLPSYAVEAYGILREAAPEADDGRREISPDDAHAALEDTDEEFIPGDIEHVLDLLYNRGEIYHVNDQIRFTDPEEFDQKYHDDDEKNDDE
jgi:GT2 family glycosyltransferase